jgi:hypothetical protein
MSAFKTVATHPPSDVISPSVEPGRVLPSLIETAPMAEQADARGAQSKSHGSASKAAHAAQEPGDGTVAGHIGEHAYLAEDLEPSIAVAPILRIKDSTTSDLSVEKAGAPRSEKRSRRPAQKQEKLDNSPGPSAKQCEPAPVGSTSGLPLPGDRVRRFRRRRVRIGDRRNSAQISDDRGNVFARQMHEAEVNSFTHRPRRRAASLGMCRGEIMRQRRLTPGADAARRIARGMTVSTTG